MSYQAIVHDLTTGSFLLRCHVEAHDLHEAEYAAISRAALAMRVHPLELDVRHLHQCASHEAATGFIHELPGAASSGIRQPA